ncbi:MAG: UPF0280 family protein [Deltaproteobacteria bacterium]|nr:UPF0280 family protein [Deltaproteobacteria bacterium]
MNKPGEYRESQEDPRRYRRRVKSSDLITFRVTVKETDLLVSAETDLTQEVLAAVWKYRHQIEGYIEKDPGFKESLVPHTVDGFAPRIVREMAKSAREVGVGPMAAVAGAIAEFVGRDLLPLSPQIILENGGDIFMVTRVERKISLFTESRSFPSFIDILIRPEKTPLGICTSSGTEGHSLSFGRADAVTVISPSAVLADAAATAAGNLVQSKGDLKKALDFLRGIPQLTGAAVLVDGEMGFWGEIEFVESN